MKKVLLGVLVLLLAINVQAKTYTKKECKQYAYQQVIKKGWTLKDYNNLVKLWNKESGWRATARNKRTGSCGIPQSLPCSKMRSEGKDYKTNCKTQIRWGIKYIKRRYKNPTSAWKHWKKKHWY